MAQTSWKVCGTGSDDAGVGTVGWTNTGNVTAIDGVNSVVSSGVNFQSHYLKGTNFGFTSGDIPVGATINGIEFRVTRASNQSTSTDASVKSVKAGTIGGTDQNSAATWSNTSLRADSLGSSSNLWGQTWAQSDIVGSATFGVVISGNTGDHAVAPVDGTASLSVDAIECRITFTPPDGLSGGEQNNLLLLGVC